MTIAIFHDQTAVETRQVTAAALKAAGMAEQPSALVILGDRERVAQASPHGAAEGCSPTTSTAPN